MLLTAFVLIELRSANPLVRLGILKSAALRRANYGAMALLGSWFGFQFIGTLYMQNLRGWSPIEMALAFLPAGLIVAFGSPNVGRLVSRVGPAIPVGRRADQPRAGLPPVLEHRRRLGYLSAMLPTFILSGIRFTLAFGPLTIAATSDVRTRSRDSPPGWSTPRSSSVERSAWRSPPR